MTTNACTSSIVHFIQNKTRCTPGSEIVLYSDGCGSQNRNFTSSNVLNQPAKKKGLTITHKYIEKGHTQMQCDGIHSVSVI